MFSKNTETRGAAINAIPTDARRHECGGITSSSRSGARFLLRKIWIWRLHTAAPHTRISTHKSFAPYFVHISTLRLTFIAINFTFDHISKQRRTVARRNGACMLSWVCIDYISQKRERSVLKGRGIMMLPGGPSSPGKEEEVKFIEFSLWASLTMTMLKSMHVLLTSVPSRKLEGNNRATSTRFNKMKFSLSLFPTASSTWHFPYVSFSVGLSVHNEIGKLGGKNGCRRSKIKRKSSLDLSMIKLWKLFNFLVGDKRSNAFSFFPLFLRDNDDLRATHFIARDELGFMGKFFSFLPGLWFWVIDKFDFSSTFTLRQTSTVDEFFFLSYFRVWFDCKDESSINTIIMLMENSKIEFHTRRCERQWRRVCARAVFAWKSLKFFLITFSRFSIGITKESTLHWKICRNAARRRKLFPHIFEFSAHRRKLNRFIFIIIIIISSHSLQSTHKREISICRFIIGREKFFAESFPFSLSDFEVSCFPPHTMLILLWHFYIENFPSTISDFSRHHTYISKVLEIVLHEKKKRTIIIFKNFPRKCRVSFQFGLKPQRFPYQHTYTHIQSLNFRIKMNLFNDEDGKYLLKSFKHFPTISTHSLSSFALCFCSIALSSTTTTMSERMFKLRHLATWKRGRRTTHSKKKSWKDKLRALESNSRGRRWKLNEFFSPLSVPPFASLLASFSYLRIFLSLHSGCLVCTPTNGKDCLTVNLWKVCKL